MKDFKISKGKQLFNKDKEPVTINGNKIYLNISTSAIKQIAKLSKTIDQNNTESVFILAEQMFTSESYKLIEFLDIEDFIMVVELAVEYWGKEVENIEQRFERSDQ